MRCNTSQFSYEARRKMFTAESSDIAPVRDFKWTNYDDGTFGIVLLSLKSGQEVRYYVSKTEYDHSMEDITAYILRPKQVDVKRNPGAAGTSIFLIND